MSDSPVRKALPGRRWERTALTEYKAGAGADVGAGVPFRDVTRQTLFGSPGMQGEWRYFEVGPGGWSTLERHAHEHAVMVLHGRGRCLVGHEIHRIGEHDLVHVPPMTWHQFRADVDAPLGFLCLVDRERDRPQQPDAQALDALRADPRIARFLAGDEPARDARARDARAGAAPAEPARDAHDAAPTAGDRPPHSSESR